MKKEIKKRKLPPGVRERNGKYTYRYSVNVIENGKKSRKQKETIAYPTAKDAYDAGILIKAEQLKGTYVDEKDISFGDWADKWLEMYEQVGKKAHTVVTRKSAVNRLKKVFGGIKLKEITTLQYQDYLYSLKKKGRKKNTVMGLHSTMSMIIKKAVNPPFEIIAKDITKSIDFPEFKESLTDLKKSKAKVKYLEKEELSKFLKVAYELPEYEETEKDRLVLRQCARALHILAYTGLRIGELCALDETDIDFDNKRINIIKTLYIQEGIEKYSLDTPKNEPSIREVDVTTHVLDLFKEQKLEKKKLKLMLGTNYSDEGFIFANAHRKPGFPLSPLEIARYMTEVLTKAGLPVELSPHKLRHTYTSLMAEAEIELSAIQRQLGHANDTKTTQIYNHVTKARRRTDVEKLEALMNGI